MISDGTNGKWPNPQGIGARCTVHQQGYVQEQPGPRTLHTAETNQLSLQQNEASTSRFEVLGLFSFGKGMQSGVEDLLS